VVELGVGLYQSVGEGECGGERHLIRSDGLIVCGPVDGKKGMCN